MLPDWQGRGQNLTMVFDQPLYVPMSVRSHTRFCRNRASAWLSENVLVYVLSYILVNVLGHVLHFLSYAVFLSCLETASVHSCLFKTVKR